MGNKSLAVVIPVYNHVRYVEAALRSVARQSRLPDEVVIVDDRSSDGSPERIRQVLASRELSNLAPRVHMSVNARNMGAHVTINGAIERCNSHWIAVLNSDDLFHHARLERLLERATNETALVFSGVRWIDELGRELRGRAAAEWREAVLRAENGLPSVAWAFLSAQITVSTGNLVFTKDLWSSLGGFCSLRYCHDWDFVLRASLRTDPLFVDEALYSYRDHAMNSFKSLGHVAREESKNVTDRFLQDALRLGFGARPSAPSPVLWPGLFEAVALKSGFLQPGASSGRSR